MNKTDALKKAIERRKERNNKDFEATVEDLVWRIEATSQTLRQLKKELTELTYTDIEIPDVEDCL